MAETGTLIFANRRFRSPYLDVIVRFRLSTLFVIVAVVAVGLLVWRNFISPRVAAVSIDGSHIAFYLTDDYGQSLVENDPSIKAALGEYGQGDVLIHDAYVSVHLAVLIIGVGIAAVLAWATVVFIRMGISRLTARRKTEK